MKKILPCMFLALFLLPACKDTETDTPAADYSALLATTGQDVILQTYAELDAQTGLLVAALTTLENAPTTEHLDAARQAWRDARLPWEQAEGFLFGPVDQQGIDPAMDSWPVNEVDLQNVLNSNNALTKSFIDQQEGTVKGFHTIEYLIFGAAGNKTVDQFSTREFEYLRACAESLKGETNKLYNSWSASAGNYVGNLLHAGTSQSIYPSQKAAVEEIVNGLITIADEVANGKINDPFSQQNVTLEESRFSGNSKADFADNIRSVRNIYFGALGGGQSATSLHVLVMEKDPGLHNRLSVRIDEAIAAIENIPGSFTTAIFDHPDEVQNAQNKVRDLLQTLQGELSPLVQSL